jgi:outer membrane biosynthesis protein TonB
MIKKTFLSLVIAAMFFSANLFATDYPGDIAGARADYLYKKLKLTNEQYATVYSTFLEAATKMETMKTNTTPDAQLKEQMTKMHDETMKSIEKILTKDQLTKWGVAKEKVCKVKPRKVVKKVTDENKEEVKKEEKKDVKKDVKKEEKKDVKKDVKKEEKKDAKK